VQPYSPERRTALVLCGTGAHGMYHAGVLRALREAGVKIDVMAGQGIGSSGAALAAIDGAARLWDADGVWRSDPPTAFYDWKWPLRVCAWLLLALVGVLVAALLLPMLGLVLVSGVVVAVAALLVVAAVVGLLALSAVGRRTGAPRRRTTGRWWWRVFGAPLDVDVVRDRFAAALWQLVRGADPEDHPDSPTLGRRYADLLADNLGQPGFRELMLVATDLDSRRDIVAALLREPYRRNFASGRADRDRPADVLDLAGAGRGHAFDMMAAGLVPACGCDPQMTTFAAEGFWRGETHRLCDRPGAVSRLLDELAAAGVSQAIVVSAVSAPLAPHRLAAPRLDPRHRLGEFLAAAESAALRDALEMARLRFDSVYLICPAHNPIGAFDFAGAYDDASDRREELLEMAERAYEDAYHQFIEPVVGASGEHLARGTDEPAEAVPGFLDDGDQHG
jgi:hypothetical protein